MTEFKNKTGEQKHIKTLLKNIVAPEKTNKLLD